MNNPTNENEKSLSETETTVDTPAVNSTANTAEADQPLIRFLENTKPGKEPEEDPFFAPLPELSDHDDEEETEDTASADEDADDEEQQSLADAPMPSDTAQAESPDEAAEDAPTGDSADNSASEPSDSVAEQSADTSADKKKIGKILGITAGGLLGLVLAVFGVLCALLFHFSPPQTVDLDKTVTLGILETNPIFACLTDAEPSPDTIDTSKIGEQQIHLTFFGFLGRTVPVSVRDLTLPAVTPYRMTVGVGTVPQPSDCVLLCEDKTDVTHKFAETPDTSTPGEQTCILLSTDAGGNTVQTEVPLTVLADGCTQNIEFGTDADAIAALLTDAYPAYPTLDMTALDTAVCGTYRVIAQTKAERAILSLVLSDTTPPTGRTHNFNLLSGTTLTPEDFVTNIKDASPVTLSYKTAPDYESLAPQTVVVEAADPHGNTAEFSCALQIWNISNALTAECGIALDDLRETLFTEMRAAGADLPTFDRSFDPSTLAPGTYDVRLHGKYSTPTVSLTMVDTVAPVLKTAPVTAYIGHTLTPDKLVAELTDATEVTLSFKKEPDTSKAGTVSVTVIAEDEGGNKTESTSAVTVIADTAAPVIYGIKTIYAQQNGTVSYRSGISAYDNADGNVSVKVDASRVDVSKIGKYTVIYTATDKAGNTATQSAAVYVTGANQASVNLYADEILAVITTPGMTDTQKASAIYTWCVGHLRYSTATSHLMGKFLEAAYSGFTSHIGNCYTYYAVASALLTRSGIENIEIQRDNPNAPHYWNLVKIGGNWYHLDTCPKWKNHEIKAFLLTDWQVRQYSINEVEGYYSFDASLYPATP